MLTADRPASPGCAAPSRGARCGTSTRAAATCVAPGPPRFAGPRTIVAPGVLGGMRPLIALAILVAAGACVDAEPELGRTGVPVDFEDFLATLPGKRRTQIRRERAQIARDGLTLETLAPGALTPELARTMHRLYLTTVDKFVHGRRYLNARFFELVAERFAHRLAWAVARKDGQIVASAFNVKKGGVLYGRYWGTFVDLPFLHFNVCFYHGIDEAIREGLHTFEPGAGGEHKRVRGFAPTVTHSVHHVEDPRLASLVRPYLERERAAILRHVDEERG